MKNLIVNRDCVLATMKNNCGRDVMELDTDLLLGQLRVQMPLEDIVEFVIGFMVVLDKQEREMVHMALTELEKPPTQFWTKQESADRAAILVKHIIKKNMYKTVPPQPTSSE